MDNTRVRPYLLSLVYAGMAALVILLLWSTVTTARISAQIRSTQVTNTHTSNNTNETLHLMRSCVTPGQSCYDRGQKQTGEAVANINRVVIYAAACAAQPGQQSVTQIQACVIRELANARKAQQ